MVINKLLSNGKSLLQILHEVNISMEKLTNYSPGNEKKLTESIPLQTQLQCKWTISVNLMLKDGLPFWLWASF